MPGTIPLEIITPTRTVYSGEVAMLRAPGTLGSFQVFPGHALFATTLEIGKMDIRFPDGEERAIATSGGFVEVLPTGITVLAETAEFAEEIDVERAAAALERARQRLREGNKEADPYRLRVALERAANRLRVAGRGH